MDPTRTSGIKSRRPRATISIIAVAVFQAVASVLTLVWFERIVREFYFSDRSSVPANAPFGLCTMLGAELVHCDRSALRLCHYSNATQAASAVGLDGAFAGTCALGADSCEPMVVDCVHAQEHSQTISLNPLIAANCLDDFYSPIEQASAW
jgi:hypothetical protein